MVAAPHVLCVRATSLAGRDSDREIRKNVAFSHIVQKGTSDSFVFHYVHTPEDATRAAGGGKVRVQSVAQQQRAVRARRQRQLQQSEGAARTRSMAQHLFLGTGGANRVFSSIEARGGLSVRCYMCGVILVQAGRPKKRCLFGHLFFNITYVFCAKKRVGHACICPTRRLFYICMQQRFLAPF